MMFRTLDCPLSCSILVSSDPISFVSVQSSHWPSTPLWRAALQLCSTPKTEQVSFQILQISSQTSQINSECTSKKTPVSFELDQIFTVQACNADAVFFFLKGPTRHASPKPKTPETPDASVPRHQNLQSVNAVRQQGVRH
jgi:hypothetical protein